MPTARRNEVISFVKGGLLDLSVSRTSFKWGVPVPDDPDHVMYVWIDALTNYLTAVGYPDTEAADFKTFWPADVHMVGKDILRFHAVYWPAFLMAAGLEPPKRIYAHGWWTSEGQKISKSLGNVIEPLGLVERYGLDQVRYFMLREVPFGNDGDFSRSAMVGRINGDLANDFGNLAQRVLSMIAKNCGGQVPAPGEITADDQALLDAAGGLLDTMREHLLIQEFHAALAAQWRVIAEANRYVDAQAPWALRKIGPGAHGDRALCAGRDHPAPRHFGPAGDASRGRAHARPACRGRGWAKFRLHRRGSRAGARHRVTQARGRVSAFRR